MLAHFSSLKKTQSEISTQKEGLCFVPLLFKQAGIQQNKCEYVTNHQTISYKFSSIDQTRYIFYSNLNNIDYINILDNVAQTLHIFHGLKLVQMTDIRNKTNFYCSQDGTELKCGNNLSLFEPHLIFENNTFQVCWNVVSYQNTYDNLVILAAGIKIRNVLTDVIKLKAFGKFSASDTQPSIQFYLNIQHLNTFAFSEMRMLAPIRFVNKGSFPELIQTEPESITGATIATFTNKFVNNPPYIPFDSKLLSHLCSISVYVHVSKVCDEILNQLPPRPCVMFLINTSWVDYEKKLSNKDTIFFTYKSFLEAWKCGKINFLNLLPLRIIK